MDLQNYIVKSLKTAIVVSKYSLIKEIINKKYSEVNTIAFRQYSSFFDKASKNKVKFQKTLDNFERMNISTFNLNKKPVTLEKDNTKPFNKDHIIEASSEIVTKYSNEYNEHKDSFDLETDKKNEIKGKGCSDNYKFKPSFVKPQEGEQEEDFSEELLPDIILMPQNSKVIRIIVRNSFIVEKVYLTPSKEEIIVKYDSHKQHSYNKNLDTIKNNFYFSSPQNAA